MTTVARISWLEIDKYYNLLRSQKKDSKIWEFLEKYPISRNDFKELVKRGWKVSKELEYDFGRLDRKNLKILIRKDLIPGYERDVTLFHEIGHIFYENIDNSLSESENEIIVEWTARKARTNHILLRNAINCFGLEPAIYDLPSCRAYTKIRSKSLENIFTKTMMEDLVIN